MNPQYQIRIVVPVSLSDVHLLTGWVNTFRALGGAVKSQVEFFPTPSVTAATIEAAKAIRDFCASAQVYPTGKEFKGGWPQACNAHFGHVVRDLAVRQNEQPWLWAELDALPMVAGAFEKLSNEYLLTGGRGAMGVIMPTVKIIGEGTPQKRVHVDTGDLYMVGVAIYDPMYYQMLQGISDQLFRESDPFDVFLRNYTRQAWRSTEQITTASRTINYRIENGELVCDDIPGKLDDYEKRGGIVPRGTTVFHHGCKDDSLAKFLVEAAGREWQTIPDMLINSVIPKPQVQASVPEVPRQVQPTIPAPEGGNDSNLAAVFAQQQALHPEDGGTPHPAQLKSGAVTLEVFRKAVSEAPKPQRVANWADQLKVPENHLRDLAKTPGSGITILNPGWVKLGK